MAETADGIGETTRSTKTSPTQKTERKALELPRAVRQ
jgi:hypothetical protein